MLLLAVLLLVERLWLEQLLKNYLHADGKMASVFGERFVDEDYRQRLLRHGEITKTRYGELDARFRKLVEAFVAGVKHYMKEHPEKVPAWGFEPEPYQPVALGRFVIWGWPAGQALSDLGRRLPRPPAFGSNQWAISRERSAEGCVITCMALPWCEVDHNSWNVSWHSRQEAAPTNWGSAAMDSPSVDCSAGRRPHAQMAVVAMSASPSR